MGTDHPLFQMIRPTESNTTFHSGGAENLSPGGWLVKMMCHQAPDAFRFRVWDSQATCSESSGQFRSHKTFRCVGPVPSPICRLFEESLTGHKLRRKLSLDYLEDVILECERLLRTKYVSNGNWTLGQICQHLRLTIEANMNGYPGWMTIPGYPLRPFLRRFMLPRLLSGNSPAGIKDCPDVRSSIGFGRHH